eukprot:TRINITY_DN13706_c0_g1_i1.p1 TRINITY_DN13706_c0_g1~~TRINITY_DN13706_c0_g1_i1.p1  ORF type:complete len:263 (-),score=51.45 TRINITY_DN13706_c0_g1_i1:57-845(-)
MDFSEPWILVSQTHGDLLRLLSREAGIHFNGLTVAAKWFLRNGRLRGAVVGRLTKLDIAYNVLRHATEPGLRELGSAVRQTIACDVDHQGVRRKLNGDLVTQAVQKKDGEKKDCEKKVGEKNTQFKGTWSVIEEVEVQEGVVSVDASAAINKRPSKSVRFAVKVRDDHSWRDDPATSSSPSAGDSPVPAASLRELKAEVSNYYRYFDDVQRLASVDYPAMIKDMKIQFDARIRERDSQLEAYRSQMKDLMDVAATLKAKHGL